MNKNNLSKQNEKTFSVELTNFEAVFLYDLLKNEYSNFSLIRKNTSEYKSLDKAYSRLFEKIENAIAHTL